ncbi:MAG: hypothetical protein IT291_04465 [Deltaproteobacteria bacterium]|nr:hypothetical protein [Deltaproteobacteria bacterium]
MFYYKNRFLFLLLMIAVLYMVSSVEDCRAQDDDYIPEDTLPVFDTDDTKDDGDVFQSGVDKESYEFLKERLEDFQDSVYQGEHIADKYKANGTKWKEADPKQHDWTKGPGHFRDLDPSSADWLRDSIRLMGLGEGGDLATFSECFQPTLVSPICTSCYPPCVWVDCKCLPNTGYTFEYWWPEMIIEVSNFGISAYSPRADDGGRLADATFKGLAEILDKQFRPGELKKLFKRRGIDVDTPGNEFESTAQWYENDNNVSPLERSTEFAGLLPGDQTVFHEAHVYQTKVGYDASRKREKGVGFCGLEIVKTKVGCIPRPFWYNGYLRGNEECFYDTLDEEDTVVRGWTEEILFAPTWRIAELSVNADEKLYKLSSPKVTEGSPLGMIANKSHSNSNESYVEQNSCTSYRLYRAENEYRLENGESKGKWDESADLARMFKGLEPLDNEDMEQICYRHGEQLYPVVQNVMGIFSADTSTSYLARRAIELISNPNINTTADYPHRPPRFADLDKSDKLQRIYPGDKPSRCYSMDEVDEHDTVLFPGNVEKESDEGGFRYVYWNKRTACVCPYRGLTTHALEGTPQIDDCSARFIPNGLKGWGCLAGFNPGIVERQSEEDYFNNGRGDLFIQKDRKGFYNYEASQNYAEAAWQLYPSLGLDLETK